MIRGVTIKKILYNFQIKHLVSILKINDLVPTIRDLVLNIKDLGLNVNDFFKHFP